MKILADENLDWPIIEWMRQCGHDVSCVVELQAGLDDASVLSIASTERRILITNDLDHGELVFRHGRAAFGILLLRGIGHTWRERLRRFQDIWNRHHTRIAGHFVVVDGFRARIRPLA